VQIFKRVTLAQVWQPRRLGDERPWLACACRCKGDTGVSRPKRTTALASAQAFSNACGIRKLIFCHMNDNNAGLGLLVTEVDTVQGLASALFAASFRGASPPDRGRHFVSMAEIVTGRWALLCYIHFQPFGDTCLGGGACTDSALLRQLPAATRAVIRAAGGPYAQLLRYALRIMEKEFFAFFGHTSDTRATRIDLEVGFRRTPVEHLLIYTPSPIDNTLERALIAKIASVGPF
jgi:hypothetical protein